MKLTTLIISLLLFTSSLALADTTAGNWPEAVQKSSTNNWTHGLKFNVRYVWLDETEYLPEIDSDISQWKERNLYLQLTKSIGAGRFGFGYIDGTIKQENELFNDTDFALTRKAPFALLDWQWTPKLRSLVRLRFEEYSDDGRSGFYQLGDDESLWTGHAVISYIDSRFWLNFSYARERDPEPIYDAINDRVELEITGQELTGATMGWVWTPEWETSAGIYYESYGSDRPDQFNYTAQLTHQPSWLTRLRASLGVGYYTEEKDTLVNLTLNFSQPLSKRLTLQLEYQLEYSDDEQSLLNQGQTILRYTITRQLALAISGEYSKENGDDRDDSLFAVASIDYSFY